MVCFEDRRVGVYVLWLISCASFASPQNSIKPRKTSPNAQNGVGQCPDLGAIIKSPCRVPCYEDEDCENHGHGLLCCKALAGSSCHAECLVPVFVPNQTNAGHTCVDGQSGIKYKVGEMSIKGSKCCRCEEGGDFECSHPQKKCYNGCTMNLRVYRHGERLATMACRNCTCSNGSVICKAEAGCPQEKCQHKNKYYKEGQMIQRGNGCQNCVCQERGWKCTAVSCTALANSEGARTAQHGALLYLAVCVCLFLCGTTRS